MIYMVFSKNKHIIFGLLCALGLFAYSIYMFTAVPKLYKKEFVLAGTFVQITSPDRRAASIVYDKFKKLEKQFNMYDPESTISRVNADAGKGPIAVDAEFLDLLRLSENVYTITKGAFDITAGQMFIEWKNMITRHKMQLPLPDFVSGFSYVDFDPVSGTCFIKSPSVKLDMGGIAKGYMVDKSIEALKESGINSALINAGGDIYCLGDRSGHEWTVGVKDPLINDLLTTVSLTDQAVATSGDYEQFFEYKGKRYSHVIDPRTKYPVANGVISVTVIAHNLTTADALATAFMVMGPEETESFLAENYSNMKVYILREESGERKLYIY